MPDEKNKEQQPQEPQEPQKQEEQQEEPEVKFEDFEFSKIPTIEEPPAKQPDNGEEETEEKPEEKPDEEEKPEEKPEEQPEQPPKSDARDYSDLPEDMIPVFKKMGNESFNRLKPIYLEHQKLKQEADERLQKGETLPESYYGHKNAYMLHPEYAETAQLLNNAQAIEDHWRTQLANVEDGNQWVDLIYDEQAKAYKYSEPKDADGKSKAKITAELNRASTSVSNLGTKLSDFQSTFEVEHKRVVKQAEEFDKNIFKALIESKDPGHKKLVEDFQKKLPPSEKGNLLAQTLVHSLATNTILYNALLEAQKALEGKVKLQKDKQKAGPNSEDISDGGQQSPGPVEVTFDDFERVKEGY